MKKIILYSIGALWAMMVSSCGSHRIYTTGSYASVKSYTEKPLYRGETTNRFYLSSDVAFGTHSQEADDFKDKKTILGLSAHMASSGKWYNYYVGVGGTAGNYKFVRGFEDVLQNGEREAFYSIGIKTGGNINYSRPKMEYRFLGLELGYLKEFGPYQDRLNELKGNPGLRIINPDALLHFNLYSEYVIKSESEDHAFTFGFYVGDIINVKDENNNSIDSGFSGFTFGFQFDKISVSAVVETGRGDIRSTKIGLTYHLK